MNKLEKLSKKIENKDITKFLKWLKKELEPIELELQELQYQI